MKKVLIFLVLIVSFHLFLLTNLRFEAWPEMLIYPYLMGKGFNLYQDIINPYLPFFNWFLLAYFSLVSLTVAHLKLLTWAIIVLIDLLIFAISFRRYGRLPALVALVFFVSTQPLLDGNGLWYDLALTPLLLLSFYFKSPFWLALAFFFKQSVIWLFILFRRHYKKLIFWLVILFSLSTVPIIGKHTLSDYLFWAFKFPFTIFPSMPGHKDFGSPGMWLIAILPFALPLLLRIQAPRGWRLTTPPGWIVNPFAWAALSFLFIFPRFGLFHLQPALAFAALSVSQSFKKASFRKQFFKLFAIGYLLFAGPLWYRQIMLFWHQPTRFFEPHILAAADKLKNNTLADKPLLFLNAPDQLLVLSQRLPTKPWAITFPWYLEIAGMQSRLINAAKNQSVSAVVFSNGFYVPERLNQFVFTNFPKSIDLGSQIFLKTHYDQTN